MKARSTESLSVACTAGQSPFFGLRLMLHENQRACLTSREAYIPFPVLALSINRTDRCLNQSAYSLQCGAQVKHCLTQWVTTMKWKFKAPILKVCQTTLKCPSNCFIVQLFAHPVFEAVEGLLASCLPAKSEGKLPRWVTFIDRSFYCGACAAVAILLPFFNGMSIPTKSILALSFS